MRAASCTGREIERATHRATITTGTTISASTPRTALSCWCTRASASLSSCLTTIPPAKRGNVHPDRAIRMPAIVGSRFHSRVHPEPTFASWGLSFPPIRHLSGKGRLRIEAQRVYNHRIVSHPAAHNDLSCFAKTRIVTEGPEDIAVIQLKDDDADQGALPDHGTGRKPGGILQPPRMGESPTPLPAGVCGRDRRRP